MKNFKFVLLFLALLLSTFSLFANEARLLRHPHVMNDKVVFVYAGDIYTVSTKGGVARQLTSFEGMELFPKFSPDGKWITFSGEYAGTRQIYVIPSEGGKPKQLTFYPDVGNMPPRGGWDNTPIDWTPDGKKILFRSNRTPYGQRVSKYFLVDPFNEGMEQPLQIPEGGPATLSPNGEKLSYCIKSREYRTWKRYKAGRAQDIWIYDLMNDTIERITEYAGTDNFPMWVNDKIYFTSDRDSVDSDEPRTLNIFCYDLNNKSLSKTTHFKEFDCLFPSRGGNQIVFENGGYLYLLNTDTDQYQKLTIFINNDKPNTRPYYKNVSKFVESFYVSPSGKRALFAARGDLFTVPAEHGDIVNITQTPSVREISVDWSPDGKYISYLSEKTGDYELYIQEYNTDKPPIHLTKNSDSWITGYIWSSDSKMVLYSDKKNRLAMLNVADKNSKIIDSGYYSSISGYRWSPDNQWIVYNKDAENHLSALWLYSLERDKKYKITTDRTDDFRAVFSADGKTISFVSRRDYDWRNRNFDAKLYVGTLQKGMESPFAPRSDDEVPDKNNKEEKKESDKSKDKKEEKLVIDVEGFHQRVVAYPLKTGRYGNLTPVDGGLLYTRDGNLYKFDMKDRKESTIMESISSYFLAADGKKFIYRKGNDYGIADVKPNQKAGEGKLDLSNMEMKIIPSIEWKQIYTDAWRIMRDWFYDPGMHGVDWKQMLDKYQVLVPHIAHRADLDYLLGELIGELNAGHTYVFSGDMEQVERIPVGVLGCNLTPSGDFYKIDKIFSGANWDESKRSPLTAPGIDVKAGEYLIGINGEIVKTDEHPYRLLENKAGKQVELLINDKPSEKGARKVTVVPEASDLDLRHLEWIERNRAIVDSLSNGRIGYIYVPNTSFAGFREFYKGWYEQFTKDGLIIDERYNGGGSIPSPMIFDMARPLLQYWARRNLPLFPTPFPVHQGTKIMLINGRSSSGGDAFPDYFRTMKLGPLMGQTTWGGLIGYGYSPSFVDGGRLAVPSSAYVNVEGEWDVEYYGVEPDIPVFDDPTLIQTGKEPMLEEAVKYILKKLEENPPEKMTKPEGPERS